MRPSSGEPKELRARRGAPPGNSNALKHGKFTRERRALLAEVRAHIRCGRALIAQCGCSEDFEMSRSPTGTCPQISHHEPAAISCDQIIQACESPCSRASGSIDSFLLLG